MKHPEIEIVNVTPTMATQWLATNIHNRPLSKRHLQYLIGVILRGEWSVTNDAICFGVDGQLKNGQHRLNAIVSTGKTVPLAVMRGVTANAMMAMDTGKKRSAGEQMTVMGIAGGNAKAALGRFILNYDDHDGPSTREYPASNQEIIMLTEGDELMDLALKCSQELGREIPGGKVVAISMGYYLIFQSWDAKAQLFHEHLRDGVGLDRNSPILLLRKAMIAGQLRQTGSSDRRKLLGMFIKAFNYWIDDQQLEVLTMRSNEEWPRPLTPQNYTKMLADRERGMKGAATRRARAKSA